MANSEVSVALEEAEKSLEAIKEARDEWENDGSKVIDAPGAMEQIGEIIDDYFGLDEEGEEGDSATGDEE